MAVMNFRTRVKWTKTKLCIPPHRITHPDKFKQLYEQFVDSGWDVKCPPLIGYQDKKIQLISGSHRWAAAHLAKIEIPVIIYPQKTIIKIWGTDEWLELLHNAPHIFYRK